MLVEIFLAIVQAATEFLPISSSGHLALIMNIFSEADLAIITLLHLASLLAVLVFLRKELIEMIKLKKESKRKVLMIIIATVPGAIIGLIFKDYIKNSLNSFLFIGITFIITGILIFLTKYSKEHSKLNFKNSLLIGLFQSIALFPGISRSGATISSARLIGIKKEEAFKFSFLLFIPISIGSFIIESKNILSINYLQTINIYSLTIGFTLCFILSLFFLNLVSTIIKKDKFWLFSFYCFFIGVVSIILHFLI
ncbi:MAG: undecaprenyl-diphosphate phosphatase [Candidatus Pacearchaeota archaeon]